MNEFDGASDAMALLAGTSNGAVYVPPAAQQKLANATAREYKKAIIRADGAKVFLGIDSEPQVVGGVVGLATLVIPAEPSVPVEIASFQVSRSQAFNFLINSITVARMNLMASGIPVPAELFATEDCGCEIATNYLAAGTQIQVSVTNMDAAAHRFNGGFRAYDLTPRC